MSEQALCTTETPVENCQQTNPETTNGHSAPVFRPHVDLVDSADAITLYADLPGVDENSLDITLEKNLLTLRALVEAPQFAGMKPLFREYAVGHYERSFTISDEIDREGIDAVVSQGLLKLTLPKTKQAALRKVTVKAG